ncbi:glycoside hydrolase family protein [Thalassospira sp.]|uniref:glycoside hydrolase family protein n=1 Tax=Thalassospira sp. TaxID=1912094 RepID=UPI000C60EA53|nr:glycoside hydrolase family protein [Thalassospira sp.]MAL41377.1 lysozyme [Thalassospira sp.]|tara:strand:- start:433 stop:876 length:444 start_codon:yes stop_codon:yes gene_type:complete
MIDHLVKDLQRDEDIRLFVYDDATGQPIVSGYTVVGHPTIGVGRLLTSDRGISTVEALELLETDLDIVFKELDRSFPWWRGLSENRQRALANMAFNLGIPRLSKFQNMLAALKRGDYQLAADEAMNSRWAKQVGARAERIRDLIKEG